MAALGDEPRMWKLSDGPPALPSTLCAHLCKELGAAFGNEAMGQALLDKVFAANGALNVEKAKDIPKLNVLGGVNEAGLKETWCSTLAEYVFGPGAGDFPMKLSRCASAADSEAASSDATGMSGGRRTPLYAMKDKTPTGMVGGVHMWESFHFPCEFKAFVVEALTSLKHEQEAPNRTVLRCATRRVLPLPTPTPLAGNNLRAQHGVPVRPGRLRDSLLGYHTGSELACRTMHASAALHYARELNKPRSALHPLIRCPAPLVLP